MAKITLQEALERVCDRIMAAKTGQVRGITPKDYPAIAGDITRALSEAGFLSPDVRVTGDDEAEFLDISARHDGEEAQVSLRWEDGRGHVLVRIDEDGDGQ